MQPGGPGEPKAGAMIAQGERQAVQPNSDEWVTLRSAVEITGDSLRSWQRRAVNEHQQARREGRQSLAIQAAPQGASQKRVWWIHRAIDATLTRYPDRESRNDSAHESITARFMKHQVEQAYRRAHWLSEWRKACQRHRTHRVTERELAERIVVQARATEGADFKISYRTLQNWQRRYYTMGPGGQIRGVEGLLRGGQSGRERGASDEAIDAEGDAVAGRDLRAIEYFYSLYHTLSRLGIALCHEMTLHEAKARDWGWSASYSATRKWLATTDDVSLSCLLREGKDVWCRRFMPHTEIDYSLIEPGQFYQTDHHVCDFWVEHAPGKQCRPWLTAVQDLRSRCVTGWHLAIKPHQDGILSAYLGAFRDFAIPERLRIDNGKDFASRLLTGVTKATRNRLRREFGADWQAALDRDANLVECDDPRFLGLTHELGISTVFSIPYAPWSKAVTERFFGTFEERCGKRFATYCANSAATKPECLEEIRRTGPVPTMDEARAEISAFIDEYHNRPHSAGDMAGRTPLEVWRSAERLRRASEDQLLFLMQTRGIYRVGANGVAFTVGGVRLTYGGGQPKLYRHTGRDVCITIDPNDLSHCFAFTPDRESRTFIARLESNERISPMATVEELREARATVGRRRKVMHRAQREAPKRTRTAVGEMRANRREREQGKLRATGTDNATANATIIPVRTGFEGASKAVKAAAAPKSDRKQRDLSQAAAALGFGKPLTTPKRRRRRATDDLLQVVAGRKTNTVKDDGADEEGTDAGTQPSDSFSLIMGAERHEREQR